MLALAGCKLSKSTGRTCHSGTLTRTELDVVNDGTNRNLTERKSVADLRSDTAS